MGSTLYHLAWLGYNLSHLNNPTSWFFAAMMLWAVWRGISWHLRRRHRWHRIF